MPKHNLTEGPVWRALTRVSAPMFLGVLAVLSFGLLDAYFLGLVGGDALAAIGFIYTVTTALSSLAIGLSAGANAAISQAIGRGADEAEVHRLSLHSLGLGVLLASAISVVFLVIYPLIFAAMGAGESVMNEVSDYVLFWTLSFPFLVMLMIANAAFRAHGDAGYASIFMICAAVVNIALNPVLIFGVGAMEGMGIGNPDVAPFAEQYLQIVGSSPFGYDILVTANAAMNARSKAVYSMSLSLGRIFAVYLPAAWAGGYMFGYTGILGAAVLANLVAVGGVIYLARRADMLPQKGSDVLRAAA